MGFFERVALVLVSLAFVAVFVVAYTFGRPPAAAPSPIPEGMLAAVSRESAGAEQAKPVSKAFWSASLDSAETSVAAATFTICHTGGGVNCVVDGDTVWIRGVKIRVADIDAPETHPPRCDYEADLGDRATRRLAELVNAGPFELKMIDRDTDRYGRKLRVLIRSGRSLGNQLVAEGLARTWEGRRRPWC